MKFEKVSKEQFSQFFPDEQMWEDIKLPRRATQGSAGYDFYMPFDLGLPPESTAIVPTGIRVRLNPMTFLMIVPRSGLGAKKRLRLNNTTGIVDFDYYFSKNEGHIIAFLANEGNEFIELKKGQAFMQGIIVPYMLVDKDDTSEVRDGGFGSTDGSGA